MNEQNVRLSVDLGRGLVLPIPLLVASGTFGYGPEYASYIDVSKLGGIIVKMLPVEPRAGNPAPRIA